jgi:acyl-CoA hydrolase
VVGIRVESLNVRTNVVKHTNSSFFTMVAKGDDEKPAVVPKLILESREDVKRFIEALRVREIKAAVKEQMDDARSTIQVDSATELLKNERCILNLS